MVFGRFLTRRGRGAEAVARLRKAEAIAARLSAADPANAEVALDLAYIRGLAGDAYFALAATSPPDRAAGLRLSGCASYEKSVDSWNRLRARNAIAAEDEPDARQAADGVRRCRGL